MVYAMIFDILAIAKAETAITRSRTATSTYLKPSSKVRAYFPF
jgi:hypothetical protein